jgi:hypothetical protein
MGYKQPVVLFHISVKGWRQKDACKFKLEQQQLCANQHAQLRSQLCADQEVLLCPVLLLQTGTTLDWPLMTMHHYTCTYVQTTYLALQHGTCFEAYICQEKKEEQMHH